MIPFPKEDNQSTETTEINDAQKAEGKGPNLIKHQNSREWRAAEIPSANGQGCASGLAKLHSLVVSNDSSLKILSEETIKKMTAERITNRDLVLDVVTRCQSEALSAFGKGDLYVEELIYPARHIEVQILGDLNGTVMNLGERERSLQRRYQKMVEIAPAPNLPEKLRFDIINAAMRLAKSVSYTNLGTIEFLVKMNPSAEELPFAFIEANARLQVEHTVTEAVTGVDLVQTQICLAAGESLQALGLETAGIDKPRGYAIQTRINMETLTADGSIRPAGGTLSAYEVPGGTGVRTDGFGYSGYETNPSFDSLLAKLIVYTPQRILPGCSQEQHGRSMSFALKESPPRFHFYKTCCSILRWLPGKCIPDLSKRT